MADGLRESQFYRTWKGIHQRCEQPTNGSYKQYGAKGIAVDQRWKTFGVFFDDMYAAYIKHSRAWGNDNTSIERIDNALGYSLENCRWATRKEQANNRTNAHLFEWKGVRKTMTDWAIALGKKKSTLTQRFYVLGWDLNKTLNT